ncbi:MAG TPA: formyltetrahydrofolate deformylase [Solirubrobacterales bacterium]|nr:formyltetrahydrofolate deformylase [Solirubrobacterales bacterium]
MTTRLLLSCPDRPGIVARVAGFLADNDRNIIDADQHSSDRQRLFMRLVFESAPEPVREEMYARFAAEVAEPLSMEHRFAEAERLPRVALMASKDDHCLLDLLWRFRSGELHGEPVLVISNHPDHEEAVRSFGLPYHHLVVTHETKPDAERAALELVRGEIDLLVLARYMQILSGKFLESLGCPAINIHHSFLPAFAGADPYQRAWERGVKLIGATAHYVTEDLDAGPIIEQDTARISHRDEIDDLLRIGRDLERLALARAVRAHLDDRVLVDGERTVVF